MQHVSQGLMISRKEKTVRHTKSRWPPLRYPAAAAFALPRLGARRGAVWMRLSQSHLRGVVAAQKGNRQP
jgi:hypothetical protein